jgi:hypothetical protein
MNWILLVAFVAIPLASAAQSGGNGKKFDWSDWARAQCDCYEYPFKPAPPCYSECTRKLSAPDADLAKVRGLDSGVAVQLRVLAEDPNRASIDFSSIRNNDDLKGAAYASIKNNELKLELLQRLQPTPRYDMMKQWVTNQGRPSNDLSPFLTPRGPGAPDPTNPYFVPERKLEGDFLYRMPAEQ